MISRFFVSLGLGALATAVGVLGLFAWWRTPDSAPQRVWTAYAAWQQELALYLVDPTTPEQFAKKHALIVCAALILGVGLYFTVWDESVLIIAMTALGLAWPVMAYKQRVQKRRELLQEQIDPALQFIANALQVAPNLEEALGLVAQHLRAPMAEEMARVSAAYRLGQSLDDALQGMAERCNDPFVTAMVTALVVGRRTGGNIAATLRRIAFSTREAVRVELELASKTKGQRNQFYLVSMLYPIGLIGLKSAMPATWDTLLTTFMGKVALGASVATVVASILWAHKILSPKNL